MVTDRALAEHARQINDAVSAYIEVQGMNAENKIREAQGLSPAYGEKEYNQVLETHNLGYYKNLDKRHQF